MSRWSSLVELCKSVEIMLWYKNIMMYPSIANIIMDEGLSEPKRRPKTKWREQLGTALPSAGHQRVVLVPAVDMCSFAITNADKSHVNQRPKQVHIRAPWDSMNPLIAAIARVAQARRPDCPEFNAPAVTTSQWRRYAAPQLEWPVFAALTNTVRLQSVLLANICQIFWNWRTLQSSSVEKENYIRNSHTFRTAGVGAGKDTW